jgi:hypothetical protein
MLALASDTCAETLPGAIVDILMDGSVDISPDSIRVVPESDLLHLAGVARSTWKNWTKQTSISESATGAYGEVEVVELVVFERLVEALGLRNAGLAWPGAREAVISGCLALSLADEEVLDGIIDLRTLSVELSASADELQSVVHRNVPTPRAYAVFPLAEIAQEARRGFWRRAVEPGQLAGDRRRRSGRNGSRKQASS